jgi:signal peptidase II
MRRALPWCSPASAIFGTEMRLLALIAALTFALDQALKWFVVQWLDLINRDVIDVIPPFLTFRMAWNTGINFGLFATNQWVLIAIALAICGWVLWWVRKEKPGRLAYGSAGLLVGGALGNVIDRIVYGAVADFLNMSCCGIENPFAFNVADIAIFAGALGLVLFTGKPTPKRRKTP